MIHPYPYQCSPIEKVVTALELVGRALVAMAPGVGD